MYSLSHEIPQTFTPYNLTKSSTCNLKSSCTAIDDVNNPAYNMENVIKQTILLEEHIAEKDKYCKPCIVKHFLHIQGLVEEALWMACNNIEQYPLLEESVKFYKDVFQTWLKSNDQKNICLDVLSKLRNWRQKLIEIYFLKNISVIK